MSLDEQDIREFIHIYEGEFGGHLSLDDARAIATRLLGLYELLARPLPEEREPEKSNINRAGT